MSLLYVEPVGGISGDMFLAGCLDLGVDQALLTERLAALELPGWTLEVTRSSRHHLSGTHVDVKVDSSAEVSERSWRTIRDLITRSGLSTAVKDLALRTFEGLARAEAHVHGTTVDEVHFHEVGGVDALIDVVGAACSAELLGFPNMISAPPPLGSGTTASRHGVIPIPGPATLELLRGRPVRFEGVGELTTPTGAALLVAFTKPGPPPPLIPTRIGIGVGTREFADRPNVLRLTLAETTQPADVLLVLEANIDDMNPQLWPLLLDHLLTAGALDAWCAPILMKKGRPGHTVAALLHPEERATIERVLFEHSTTLGVRAHEVTRRALDRRWVKVETRYGAVRIKVGSLEGVDRGATPELEDAIACATTANVPVKAVLAAAIAAYEQLAQASDKSPDHGSTARAGRTPTSKAFEPL